MRLHNYAIENDGARSVFLSSFEQQATETAARRWLQVCRSLYRTVVVGTQGRRADLLTSAIREKMTGELKERGITRPVMT